jgi:hypothetical protein
MDLGDVTLETFEPHVGDVFTIADEPVSIELVLHSALALGEWPGGRQPFSLTFRGPLEPPLAQAIYALEHAELGVLEIFVVPIGQDASGTLYEAVFT